MNARIVRTQILIFSIQWSLMLFGFALLAMYVRPATFVPSGFPFDHELNSILKGGIALVMSAFWLYIWDRQVRFLIYRHEAPVSRLPS